MKFPRCLSTHRVSHRHSSPFAVGAQYIVPLRCLSCSSLPFATVVVIRCRGIDISCPGRCSSAQYRRRSSPFVVVRLGHDIVPFADVHRRNSSLACWVAAEFGGQYDISCPYMFIGAMLRCYSLHLVAVYGEAHRLQHLGSVQSNLTVDLQHNPPAPVASLAQRVGLAGLAQGKVRPDQGADLSLGDQLRDRAQHLVGGEDGVVDSRECRAAAPARGRACRAARPAICRGLTTRIER